MPPLSLPTSLQKKGELLEKQYSPRLRFVRRDVINEADVAAAVKLAVAEFPGLTLHLVTLASLVQSKARKMYEARTGIALFNVNVRGVMYGYQASHPSDEKPVAEARSLTLRRRPLSQR